MKKVIELLQELHPDRDYDSSSDCISDGLIDSVDMQRLLAMIDEEYDVQLSGTELMPMNFANTDAIRDLLMSHGLGDDI